MCEDAPQSTQTPQIVTSLKFLDDSDLTTWLLQSMGAGETVLVAYSKHLIKVCVDQADAELFMADPADSSGRIFKALAAKGLLNCIEIPFVELNAALRKGVGWLGKPLNVREIRSVLKSRKDTLGRGKPISDKTKREVWNAAGGRCMYRGCSADLTTTQLTIKASNIAYLAHIVASDPDGPRGGQSSHALSDDPENIMLMCDAHHRLIDRVDVAGHSIDILRDMRKERCDSIRSLLDNLSYPRTQAITLLSDIANVVTLASDRDLKNAMYKQKRCPLPNIRNLIHSSARDDRDRHGFWNDTLHEHEHGFREIKRVFIESASGNKVISPERIAVFPLMSVPMLVLCGRIAGRASPIDVYQYDRDRQTWEWNYAKNPKPLGEFQVENTENTQVDEVLLSIELTASLDTSKLPQTLQDGLSEYRVAWVRIVAQNPGYNCISRPEDLEQFSTAAAAAIRHVNDEIRARKIHLVGISPASSLFRFGQMLQAGHHPECIVYDRSNEAAGFLPAIIVGGDAARAVQQVDNTNYQTIISLR